ncbi:hypothetical protein F5141DRAFT_1068853 [Pisolithus sp. B1]|nr:hypothetical protein F5141DRAFT_1068853 [Pisolithus sp. B1]
MALLTNDWMSWGVSEAELKAVPTGGAFLYPQLECDSGFDVTVVHLGVGAVVGEYVDQSEPVEQGQTKEALTGVSQYERGLTGAPSSGFEALNNMLVACLFLNDTQETIPDIRFGTRIDSKGNGRTYPHRCDRKNKEWTVTAPIDIVFPAPERAVPGENGTSSDLQPDGEETSRQNSLDCLDIFLSVVDGRKVSMSYLSSADVIVVAAASPGKSKTHENGRFNIA